MTVAAGGNIDASGLIFNVDMQSRHSWKGYPSENLVEQWSGQGTQGAPVGVYDLPDRKELERKLYGQINQPTRVNEGASNWLDIKNCSFSPAVSVPDGKSVVVSLYIYVAGNVTNRFNCQLNLGSYNSNFGLGGQTEISPDSHDIPTNTWQRMWFRWTNSTGSTQSLSSVRVECYTNAEWSNSTVNCYGTNFQVEISDHIFPSQPHYGTTTSTQVLLDTTNTSVVTVNDLVYLSDNTFEFADSTDYATINNLGNTAGDITLMGWCNQESRNGPHQTMICTHESYRHGVKLLSQYHGQGPAIWIANNTGSGDFITTRGTTIENTGNHHVAGSYNSSTGYLKLYLDGVLIKNVDSGITGNVYMPNTNYGAIGREYHSTSYGYNGKIYSVRAYNRVLSDDEVAQNFQVQRGIYGL